jgi:SAM-dependent methyltransferase
MREDNLDAQRYYEGFEYSGWDLNLMREVLEKMDVPPDVLESIQNKEKIKFLVLGSATAHNLDNMAKIDKVLRPGKGAEDTVTIIDYNMYPLERHKERTEFLERWEASHKRNNPNEKDPLPYPKFNLAQADMKQLPFEEGSADIVVSDYTFNFLSTQEDIDKAFAEVARVLPQDGTMLIAVNGNDKYKPDKQLTDQQMEDLQEREVLGGTVVKQFPIQTYLAAAERHGLELTASDFSGSDLLCGVLRKRKVVEKNN